MNIVSIGEITIDRYLRQALTFVGGISLNFAVNAKRSGADKVSLISCVGDGPGGALVLETLAREQIDSSHVAVLAGETAVCEINVYDNADRVFPDGGYLVNVLSQLHLTDETRAFINQHDILVTLLNEALPDSMMNQVLHSAHDGCKRVIDFGDWSNGKRKSVTNETFDKIDLAFISGDEATVNDMLPLAERVNCLIVVTLGAEGSVALTPHGVLSQAAIEVETAIDSTGCGDAFQAAFTVNYFRDGNIANALHEGATQAARVLKHYGAFK
jgi:fructoselysine 6-kinase